MTPLVLLLHSGIGDGRQWRPQLERWRGRLRPAAPELWGHAGPLLDEPGAVVGSSLGGRLALELALARPELVERLVLVCPGLPGRPPSPELEAIDARETELVEGGELEAAAELMVETWVPGAPATVRAYARECRLRAYSLPPPPPPLDPPVGTRLAEVRAPTLLVDGERDRPEFRAIVDRLERELPDVRGRVTIPGAYHRPNLERPAEFDAAVLAFLGGGRH